MRLTRLAVRNLSLDVPGRRLLDDISFELGAGQCFAVMGPSGSGKTSLLNCLSGIVVPSGGSVCVDGMELSSLGLSERSAFRLEQIGVVFQFGELLPELSALENAALPLRLQGLSRDKAETRATEWLDRLRIGACKEAHLDTLSGGEVQRVGLARALAHEPVLVLADEPTGALDEENTQLIIQLLVGSAREFGAAVVISTHDPLVAAKADRVLRLRDGRLIPLAQTAERYMGSSPAQP